MRSVRQALPRVRSGTRTSASPGVARAAASGCPCAVGERIVHLIDRSRTVTFPGRAPQPRPITVVVRYPALGRPGAADVPRAPPDRRAAPFPLLVFGHGFAVTPATYTRLLHDWSAAGFVVAAPVFPLENADAPGGPDERDLIHQPRDMRFVISWMLAADRRAGGWAAGLIDRSEIAVAGHSDGGETALAAADDRGYRDPRIRAAVLLSGARLPEGGAASLSPAGPPLLLIQGTADPIDPPANSTAVFDAAPRPAYLLELIGASHLAPYTGVEQPQFTVVLRATIAFLREYLQHQRGAAAALRSAAERPRIARLLTRP